MTITPQNIITAAALLGACGSIVAVVFKFVRWMDRQRKQDEELQALRKGLQECASSQEVQDVKEELQVVCYGLLACLDGLKQCGANGNVTKAHATLDKHLNKKAHE